MKFFQRFLLFLLSFLALLGLIFLLPVPPDATGTVHPEFSTMQKSGSGIAASPLLKWLACFFGLGVLGLFAFFLFLGARRSSIEQNRKIRKRLAIGMGWYILMFSLTIFGYWSYQGTAETTYFLGFPYPTAWMLYGVVSAPLFFLIYYVVRFEQWVISPEEEAQFRMLVKERRDNETGGQSH